MTKKMKYSGVEWIGEIPMDWETRRLKVALVREKEIVDRYSNEDILSLTKSGVVVRDLVNPKGKMPTTFDGYQLITKGNIVTCLFDIDVTPRCVGIANNDGLTSPAYTQYKVINKFDLDFIYYYLLMLDNDKILVPITKSLRNTIKSEDFLNLEFSFPNSILQKKISTSITTSISRINQLIDETRQSIEELKKYKKSLITEVVTKGLTKNVEMKNAGNIEIPEKWEYTYLGNIFNFIGGNTYKSDKFKTKTDNQVIRISNVKNFELNLDKAPVFIDDNYAKETETYKIKVDDILFTMTGTKGKRDYFFSKLITKSDVDSINLYLNQRVGILRRKSPNLCLDYFDYVLKIDSVLDQVFDYETGTANQGNIGFEYTKKVRIPLPSIEEQKEIVSYLGHYVGKIDLLLNYKDRIIGELESYKRSLIYEYVTGKKEV